LDFLDAEEPLLRKWLLEFPSVLDGLMDPSSAIDPAAIVSELENIWINYRRGSPARIESAKTLLTAA
jgi:hypothetical protein